MDYRTRTENRGL